MSIPEAFLSERDVNELTDIFSLLNEGARVGFLCNDGDAGQIARFKGQMFIWEVGSQGVSCSKVNVDGFPASEVALLLVANSDAVRTLETRQGKIGSAIARCTADGNLLTFYLISHAELMDFGFQILFDALPHSFAGACR